MEEGSINVLVDAKEEYTKQLVSILRPCIYQGLKSICLDAKDICNQDNTPENVLMIFQDLLSRIPKWSQDIINKEYQRIVDVSQCDYIEDLLKVVYISHIKILTIVHSAQKNKKITLKLPSGSHFMHLCYIECAREFWKNPFLFSDRVTKYENQKNMRDSESMISECITETIRKQLPVRNILKEYLTEPDETIQEQDDTDASEDIKNPINKKYLKRLETMVRKELLNLAKEDQKKDNSDDQQVVKETIKNLDEDVIRRIIKEEMDSRIREGNAPTTVTPKKDVVNDVVEKIIEQVEEQVNTTNNDETKIETNVETNVEPPTTVVEEQKIEIKTESTSEVINVKDDLKVQETVENTIEVKEVKEVEKTKEPDVEKKTPKIKIADIDEINLDLDELSIDDEPTKEIVPTTSESTQNSESITTEHKEKTEDDQLEEMISNSLDDLESFDLKSVKENPEENTDTKSIFFKNVVKSVFG